MMREREVLQTISSIHRETLYFWIERGWVSPEPDENGYRFRDIDVARLQLIEEFRREFELGDDAIDVILPLLDQVHGLRRQLRQIADAVSAEPEDVRSRIARRLQSGPE